MKKIFLIMCLLIVPFVSASQVAYWGFDDGTANDISGNNNNGIVYGAMLITGIGGGALSFDAVDDYVYVPDSETLDLGNSNFTISVWINSFNPASYDTILDKDVVGTPSGIIRMNTEYGKIYFFMNSIESPYYGAEVSNPITANEVHHVVATRSNSEFSLWLDGVKVNTTISDEGSVNNDKPLIIGSRNDFNPRTFFNGTIDEVKIYNHLLSDDEIIEEYRRYSSQDKDGDGVLDNEDMCPNTVLPEYVPTKKLLRKRYVDIDGDGIFETKEKEIVDSEYSLNDTYGCTCEQILDLKQNNIAEKKFGCRIKTIEMFMHER